VSEDKPDRFEEKAQEICEKIADGAHLFATIAQALREESKTQLVSGETLIAESTARYGAPNSSTELGEYWMQKKEAFEEGARWAMHMRATEDIAARWPSEQDLNNYYANALRPEYSKGVQACYDWLKKKLGIE